MSLVKNIFSVNLWMVVGFLFAPLSALSQTSISFPSVEDATIKGGSPSSNYGGSSTLEVDTTNIESLLKFTVSGTSGTISSAKIRLFITNGSNNGPKVYLTSSSWLESSVNY